MPHSLRAHPALDGEQHLAQALRLCTDGTGLGQDEARLARGVEHPLGHGQHHGAGPIHPGVGAQQGLGAKLAHLDAPLKQAHQHFGANGRRTGRVAAVVNVLISTES
jgi:hypothetical protein